MEFKKKDVKIIILSGHSGSGKTTISNIIKKCHDCIVLSYSSYIKNIALNVTDWSGSTLTKPRLFLQQFGDVLRNYDKNIFINRMLEDIYAYSYFYDLIVIDDARFASEIEVIKKNYDVLSIRIMGSKKPLEENLKNHITETSLDNYNDFDYVIENDINVEDKLRDILRRIYE